MFTASRKHHATRKLHMENDMSLLISQKVKSIIEKISNAQYLVSREFR